MRARPCPLAPRPDPRVGRALRARAKAERRREHEARAAELKREADLMQAVLSAYTAADL